MHPCKRKELFPEKERRNDIKGSELCIAFCLAVIKQFQRIGSSFIQGRSETSEQDEASFECRRREPLGGCGGMLPQKMLKSRGSEMLL